MKRLRRFVILTMAVVLIASVAFNAYQWSDRGRQEDQIQLYKYDLTEARQDLAQVREKLVDAQERGQKSAELIPTLMQLLVGTGD